MFWIIFSICFGACAAAAATGSYFAPDEWYQTLKKPSWTPPNWVFPLAWSILYLTIAYTGARIATTDTTGLGMALWSFQIALNTLWSPIFFGAKKLGDAFVIILLLWATVISATASFFAIDTLSGWLFVPYAFWVSYAAALNAWIYFNNRDA